MKCLTGDLIYKASIRGELEKRISRVDMVNGVNLNDELNNTQIDRQLGVSSVATNPINNPYRNIDKNLLIDETAISDEAVNLYQKEQDVQKFTALMMSDPNDMSHQDIIDSLFSKGLSDPFSDETLQELAGNQNLLGDLNQ